MRIFEAILAGTSWSQFKENPEVLELFKDYI